MAIFPSGELPKEREQLTAAALRLERVLRRDPTHAPALAAMSLIALASRQYEAAIAMARAAAAAAPGTGAVWVTLGQALRAGGRYEEAKQAYGEAIRQQGVNAWARTGLGELLFAQRMPEAALAEYDLALRDDPALISAHVGRAHALAAMERGAEALESYERASALAPRTPEAEFGAGFVLAWMGREDEAERRYRRALLLRPDFAAAWMNLGCLLRADGRDVAAEAALRRAVELRPDMIPGWINLAQLLREQKRGEAAKAQLRKAFEAEPGHVDTLIAWSQLWNAERDEAAAWAWLRWALLRDPENAEAVNMKGVLLHGEGRYDEAVGAFERAEELGSEGAASNRANSLMELGRMEASLQAHEAAVARDGRHPGARYNLALAQLRLGDWAQGWTNYEARWRFREVHPAPKVFRQRRWRGEPLGGERILLHAEQGLGDAIQFCRYVPLVVMRGARAIVQVHGPVERLVRSMAVVEAGQAEVVGMDESPPAFDWECPLMSLPAVFQTRVETVPWTGAYLTANAELVAAKKARWMDALAGEQERLRVGIAWAGNPKYGADARRSMKLATMEPLLGAAGITWVSLQKGEAARQLRELPGDLEVLDGSSGDKDLAETAALVALLDLVITTDTSIAHLAGALGKPVWILLAHLADWRWMEKVETTPWYPTARLFRQERAGDWRSALERVRVELGQFEKAEVRPEIQAGRRAEGRCAHAA